MKGRLERERASKDKDRQEVIGGEAAEKSWISKPSTITMALPAKDDWSSTGLRVEKGQKIRIIANGEIDLGGGYKCGPEGHRACG